MKRHLLIMPIVAVLSGCEGSTDATVDPDCETLATNLGIEIGGSAQGCTAVVRLESDTYTPTSWTLFCGPYAEVSEAQARMTAKADVDYGVNVADRAPGDALNPQNPADAYVFAVPPADFGGFSVVSARTGLTLLGGRLRWSAPATLTYPTQWRDQAHLGSGCDANVAMPPNRVYDFADNSLDPKPEDVDKALAAISQTALPSAFTRKGILTDIVLVRLQRTVDGSSMATSTSEWVVLLDGGAPK